MLQVDSSLKKETEKKNGICPTVIVDENACKSGQDVLHLFSREYNIISAIKLLISLNFSSQVREGPLPT